MLIYDVVYDVNKTLAVLHGSETAGEMKSKPFPPQEDNQIEVIPPGNSGGNGNGIEAIAP